MCTLSLQNEVTRLPWHCTSKHNYAAYKLQYSEGLASIYMTLRANAVRLLEFRLPETFLPISGIISLLEWVMVPLQGFLLPKKKQISKKCRHTPTSPVEFESKIPVREVDGSTCLVPWGHRNWKFATNDVAWIFNKFHQILQIKSGIVTVLNVASLFHYVIITLQNNPRAHRCVFPNLQDSKIIRNWECPFVNVCEFMRPTIP